MKTATNFQEKNLSLRAKNMGLQLQKGYQQYLRQGLGCVKDEDGNLIEGYMLLDCTNMVYHPSSYNEIHTHCLTSIEDVKKALAGIAQERGLV